MKFTLVVMPLLTVSLLLGTSTLAYAEEDNPSVSDGLSLLQSSLGVVPQTGNPTPLLTDEPAGKPHATARGAKSLSQKLTVPDLVDPDTGQTAASGITLHLDDASGETSTKGSLASVVDPSLEKATYIQSYSSGVELYSVTSLPSAELTFSYTFEVPDGSQLIQRRTHALIVGPDSSNYGVLGTPTAATDQGAPLPTTYTWEGTTLTQHVTVPEPEEVALVVAATPWTYVKSYDLNKSPETNWFLMHGCFNCFFPIAGAPHNWPSIGQDLPLTVAGIGNFHCKYDFEDNYLPTGFEFSFISAEGHIDGIGSMIQFDIYNDGGNKLLVYGVVQNQSLQAVSWIYLWGAGAKWQEFADKLNGMILT